MIRITLLLICLPLLSFAQLYDDFSDGNFTDDPVWSGTTGKFKINNDFQLQLNDTAASTAWLTTGNTMAKGCEWRFWIKFSFSPSANNNGRVYLLSDTDVLSGEVHGYFLQFGESGSQDAIELFRQDGNQLTSVCRGNNGLIASSFSLGIKVVRDSSGLWRIFVDKQNNGIYLPETEGFDTVYHQTSNFGFVAKYTKSNAKKFFWDDVYVGDIIVDNQPPAVEQLSVLSDSVLLVKFNEPVDTVTAGNSSNYVVTPDIGNPYLSTVSAGVVNLYFSNKFQPDVSYTLTISGITDLSGNVMDNFSKTFSYYVSGPYDVVFNEIFPDPNPPVALPPYEFIELLNRTEKTVSLNGWTLTIGSSDKIIEDAVIEPHGFLLLGKQDAGQELAAYGPFYGFSGFSLTNAGQSLILKDPNGQIIDQVHYKKSWYRDPDKENGGWTLEKINPDAVCSGAENWKASVNDNGGTPGQQNSVWSETSFYPVLKQYALLGDDVMELQFNQKMDKESLSDPALYFVDNNIGRPSGVFPDNNDASKVGLFFDTPWKKGIIYSLTLNKMLKNCAGIPMQKDTVIYFGIPETTNANDVVINEILFNPLAGGDDYVEIFNRSEKLLDISLLMLGSVKISPPNPPDTLWYQITSTQKLLFPESYLVFTKSPEKVKNQYYTENPENFIKVNPFPAYKNDKGTVLLKYDSLIIDAFNYSEKMHFPLLQYTEGVSLERVNPDIPSYVKENWHSAAESAGFGTPGYKNSQYSVLKQTDDKISVSPQVFSPDNDGNEDVLNIIYNFDKPGNNISIDIFSKDGLLVKKLVDNKYVGTSGSFIWDGITDENSKAQVGIYIIFINVFNADGYVKSWKKAVVVATKW